MKYKSLKITVKQYDSIQDVAKCKLTISLNDTKYSCKLSISNTMHYLQDDVINNLILNYSLIEEMNFIFYRSREQMRDKKWSGIDTYWKWGTKS